MRFREATARDRDAILALRERCFIDRDSDPARRDPRFWDWEFSRARVFVGERDGAIVTHLAIVPWGDRMLAVDAMTAPEARGTGAYSGVVAHAIQTVGGVLHAYQIRKTVLGPMLRSEWTIAEAIPVLVRPAWRWGRRGTATILTREHAPEMALIARSREFIEWRFFDNPLWTYRVTGKRDRDGKLVGWLAGRRTTLKGFDTFAIVDLAGDASALIADAVRQPATLTAAFVSKAHPARPLFWRHLFIPGPHRFRLLTHGTNQKAWHVTWADTDHL